MNKVTRRRSCTKARAYGRALRSRNDVLTALIASLVALGSPATAQQLPPPPPAIPPDLPIATALYDAQQLATLGALPFGELQQTLALRGVRARDDGKVHVEVIGPKGATAIRADVLRPFGGEISSTWRRRADAWIPIDQLVNVARALPAGYSLEWPRLDFDDVTGEGPAAINSTSYRDNGADGSGLTIAIIDGGYNNLTAARSNGDAPPTGASTNINYTSNTFESSADGQHGTGCVEAAYDHCPGATWRLYKIDSLTDVGNAVDDAIDNSVDIISHSLSWYNEGWDDDDGDACAAANAASDAAILFFTSAGNAASEHWQGNFASGAGSADWHDWNSGGGDETLDLTVPNSQGATFNLSWDTAGGTYNYDLYLYDSDLTTVLGSGTRSGNNYESFAWTNTTGATRTVHLAVYRRSGGVTEFEVFVNRSANAVTLEYVVASGSNTTPSNATHANVISVGAVSVTDVDGDGTLDYSESAGRNTLQSYSGRGPSNSGMTLPDLCGPTDTTGFTYPNGFGGTSSATPNVAGATCAFRSSQLYLNTYPNGWLMRAQAEIYKDWGSAGNDNLYGYGGARLVDFHWNTYWVSRAYGNTSDSAGEPYFHVSAAQAAAPAGGRIVYVYGGSYPEPITLNKEMRHETLGTRAVLGD